MEQPWNQQREGASFAMGESSCHAADTDMAMTTDLCEVDGALLMELIMEDLPSSSDLLLDGDVDRQLSRVIRSLEAEIGAGDQQAAVMMSESDDGGESLDRRRIEDVFSDDIDMDGYDYEGASSSFLAGHYETEGWCVYTNTNGYEGGSVLGYDTVDLQYYCCAESSADHMYLPLWE